MIYRKWDYTNNTVTTLERQGECNGCGACCKAVIRFLSYPYAKTPTEDTDPIDNREGGLYADEEGVWNEVENEQGERRLFKVLEIDKDSQPHHRCSALSVDNRCAVHSEKFLICKGWPFAPEQVEPFEECSYRFNIVSIHAIE